MGSNVNLEDKVHVRDNCSIGDNVTVSKGVIVRDNASIGNSCRIGRFSDIGKNSIIGNGTRVFVRAAISSGVRIGEQCTIGADCVISADIADNVKIPSSAHLVSDDKIISDVIVIAKGTLTATFYETRKSLFVKMRSSIPLNVDELTVKSNPELYQLAKSLFPERFSFRKRLLNKLAL